MGGFSPNNNKEWVTTMVIPSVNFLSYNSTGLDSIKAEYIRNLYNLTNCSFISIQEHFKKTKSIDKFFKDNFPEHTSYVIPGFREIGQDTGRPKGGIAQLRKKKIDIKVDRVETKSFRIQAQILHFPNSRLLWLNTYFPTDPGGANFDENELIGLLMEIENIMDRSEFDDVLWNGDLNYDKSRNTGFVTTVSRFLDRLGLVSVWDRFAVDYTHIHTDFLSTSTLDHFVVNERLLDLVLDCGPLHLGDNPSRHSPIVIKLNIAGIPVKSQVQHSPPKKPDWYKATEQDIMKYTLDLHNRLSALEQPQCLHCTESLCKIGSHSEERDSHVLDILSAVVEASHASIPLSGGKYSVPDPKKTCPVSQAIPGWKEEVEPLRQESLFWHSVWRSAGRPRNGLHEVMKKTRYRYHHGVRLVKKKAGSIKAKNLLEASETGSIELLKEMKRIKGGKKTKLDLPESVAGACGEKNIVEKFREFYEEVYNSSESNVALEVIKNKINELLIEANSVGDTSGELIKLTGDIVKQAACKMKPNKGDVSEGYTSNALLNGPDILFELLAAVFQSWLIHGTVTLSLLACAFLPLLKNSLKNPADVSSYRAIAGSSLILKLFDQVVLILWGHLLQSDPLQFGYKTGYSTTQCSWFVMETASYFIRKKTPVIVTLLDCTMAFDKCRFDVLFEKLLERKLPPIVLRVLLYVYQEQYAWVKWGNEKSRRFRIQNGTRQGSVLSPSLFSVYMDELLSWLRKSGVGCHVGGVFAGAVGYADDLLLLAPSRSAMVKMLKLCEKYALETNLHFSTHPDPDKSKSKCIYMTGHMKVRKPVNVQLYGVDLPFVKTASHLGHQLSEACTMDQDIRCRKAEFIGNTTDVREMFSFAQPNQIIQAVKTYCCSMHNCMTWQLFGDMAKQFYNCWNTCVKLAWDVDRAAKSYFVDNLLAGGLPSLRSSVLACYGNFYHGVRNSSALAVRTLACIAAADVRSSTGSNLLNIEKESGFAPQTQRWKARAATLEYRRPVPAMDRWRIPCLQKFLAQRYQMNVLGEDVSEVDDLILSLVTS